MLQCCSTCRNTLCLYFLQYLSSSSSFLFSSDRPWLEHDGLHGVTDPVGTTHVKRRGRRLFYLPLGPSLCFREDMGLQSPLSDTSPGSPRTRESSQTCRLGLQCIALLLTAWWWREEGGASWTLINIYPPRCGPVSQLVCHAPH